MNLSISNDLVTNYSYLYKSNYLNSNNYEDERIDDKKSSKKSKSTFPFGKCKVCNDKATGVHYGIATCEGCKGFFKRSTLRKEKYRCFFGNNCPLTPDNRNRCKACRYRRCCEVGMSIQGVKMGRIPKAEKEKAINENKPDDSNSSLEPEPVTTETTDVACMIKKFSNFSPMSDGKSSPESYIDSFWNRFKLDDNDKNSLEIDEFITKSNYTIINLIKSQTPFRSCNIIANRHHSNIQPNFIDDSYHIISSLLADKVYQIYLEHNEKVEKLLERASMLISHGVHKFDGWDADESEVWDGLLESIPVQVQNLIMICKEIPGLNELGQRDLTNLVNNRLFDYFLIKHSPLFINGESYMMLPNRIQYTRDWMVKIIGEEMVEIIFDFANQFNMLKMTTKEIALMYPFILTVPDENYKDPYTIANLNEYFYRALMYEFDLNRRNNFYVNRWKKLVARLPEINEIQAKRIGGLTPKS